MVMNTGIVLLACALAGTAAVQPAPQVLPDTRAISFVQLDRAEAIARYGHPNEMWRYRALRALKLEQPERALDHFRLAARYGDKFSQHALSLMHWHGAGTATNRAEAYVWADLAAERGYRDLLLLREKMWLDMSAAQRTQALQVGEAMYAEYGDVAARPRMARAMRKALASTTGSRLGFTRDRVGFTQLSAQPGGPAMGGAVDDVGLSDRDYYADPRWEAEAYWREQDRQWNARVIVRPPEQLPEAQPEVPPP